jgi:hypothetical protein
MDWISPISRWLAPATIAETADGGLLVASAPGRYVQWLLLFLVLLPVSRWCWRRKLGGNLAPGVFYAAFAIPLVVVPGIALESIRVAPDGLSVRTGLWFSPTERAFPFAELDEIVESEQEIDQRDAERRDRVWSFRYRTAAERRLKLPDLLDANREPVIESLRRRGIEFRATAAGGERP